MFERPIADVRVIRVIKYIRYSGFIFWGYKIILVIRAFRGIRVSEALHLHTHLL